jgi:excisionase family DNA binding protein
VTAQVHNTDLLTASDVARILSASQMDTLQQLIAALQRIANDPERSVPVKEAAMFLGVSVWTVQRLVKAETLPAFRIGDRLVIRRADLMKVRESFTVRSGSREGPRHVSQSRGRS